jgi:hypothetical protein
VPCSYKNYPQDWKHIRQRILERAKHRCEQCGVKNYAMGYRERDGRFVACDPDAALDMDKKPLKIILTTAHLCECRPLCGNEDHLQSLCQACHNRLDGPMRRRHARQTRRAKLGNAGGSI